MSRREASIKDVAALAGVSTATVSNVLNGTKPVSTTVAGKVRKAADELGYRINRAASQLRSGKNRVVGVIVPDLSDPFFTSIITELEGLARPGGYEIIVANSNDDVQIEHGRLDALLAWRPAAMVIIPCTDNLPPHIRKEGAEVPMVLADRVADTGVVDTVLIDNIDAGKIAARYLTDIGHRDVLLAPSDLNLAAIRQRCEGAESAIRRVGGRVRKLELGSEPNKGAKTLTHWLERNDAPTAIIAMTDITTLGVLTSMAQRKIDIPNQISIVGFDDYPWMSARRTAITAVRQPIVEIAQAIWERLDARMNGDDQPPQTTVLECSLTIRDSARPIPCEKPSEDRRAYSKEGPGEFETGEGAATRRTSKRGTIH